MSASSFQRQYRRVLQRQHRGLQQRQGIAVNYGDSTGQGFYMVTFNLGRNLRRRLRILITLVMINIA